MHCIICSLSTSTTPTKLIFLTLIPLSMKWVTGGIFVEYDRSAGLNRERWGERDREGDCEKISDIAVESTSNTLAN